MMFFSTIAKVAFGLAAFTGAQAAPFNLSGAISSKLHDGSLANITLADNVTLSQLDPKLPNITLHELFPGFTIPNITIGDLLSGASTTNLTSLIDSWKAKHNGTGAGAFNGTLSSFISPGHGSNHSSSTSSWAAPTPTHGTNKTSSYPTPPSHNSTSHIVSATRNSTNDHHTPSSSSTHTYTTSLSSAHTHSTPAHSSSATHSTPTHSSSPHSSLARSTSTHSSFTHSSPAHSTPAFPPHHNITSSASSATASVTSATASVSA
ncbi:hypothetical protein IAT38_008279 [Cryptococcus sp. DSM 104549]